MKPVILGLLLSLSLTVLAQDDQPPLKPRDFAYGMALEVDGDGALYSFDLPEEVYRHTVRKDLGDMRLFNGYNEVVPHLLTPAVKQEERHEAPVPLRFFPLYSTEPEESGDTQIHIATDESGAVVDFWQRTPQGEKATINRYLIDASAAERPLEKLLLEWDETGASLLETVSLEQSDDLTTWQPLPGRYTLAALNYEGYRLSQRELELPALQARYLRLSWPLGEKGIQLRGVSAVLQPAGGERPRQWLTLSPGGEAARRGSYPFDSGGHFPVDRLQVHLPQPNTVVRASLYSRPDQGEKTRWRLRYRGLFYQLHREGHTLRNDPIALDGVEDRYWRLDIDEEGGGIGQGQPQIQLGWLAHHVYFVARGETPFSLAYGAAGVESRQADLHPLLNELQQSKKGQGFIKDARPGTRYELGGKRRLQPAPPPLPWQRWMLWTVLVIGVLVLALMARNLLRQMNAADRID